MRSPIPIDDIAAAVSNAGAALADAMTPTVKLGVTGLSRAGKTVFITSLVRCLTQAGADPSFARVQGIEGFRAYLEPQPNDDVPRFAYEDHLAKLTDENAQWPESTRQISQLRLTLEWRNTSPRNRVGRFDLMQRLHIDIIDYPGEWLGDLALLDLSFSDWSRDVLFSIKGKEAATNQDAASPFLEFLDGVDGNGTGDEQVAIAGAEAFTTYLGSVRQSHPGGVVPGPGRFLMPGDLEGSPQLTFFPLPWPEGQPFVPGTLGDLLQRRFESYKANIVVPFFKTHFSRLDRQIVLVDVLGSLNGGAEALNDLEHALAGALDAFRPGRNTWISRFFARRIDRIVFAATKADHLHQTGRQNLEAILKRVIDRAWARAEREKAGVKSFAIAALRATEDVERSSNDELLPCIRGVPVAGEKVGHRQFDGSTAAVVFPGDLPSDPLAAFERDRTGAEQYNFVRFKPPLLGELSGDGLVSRWPHINLDKVFAFLIGDYLP